jgi:hypothetical protein
MFLYLITSAGSVSPASRMASSLPLRVRISSLAFDIISLLIKKKKSRICGRKPQFMLYFSPETKNN